jgi:muramoyltetrapeptide carboxypeptidase
LHTALLKETGLATIYGNGLAGVGDAKTTEFTRDRLLAVLNDTAEPDVPRNPDDPYVRALRGGRATAPLVGGCLWLLMQSMGTPWEFDVDGAIFFFEDVKAPPYYVDGFLTQLRLAGKLDNVAGVVVGEMKDCDWGDQREASDWARSRSIEDVLEQHLEPLGVPVLYNLPLGHGKHLASIPLGVRYTLDADRRMLTLEEPPFRA